MSPDNQPIFDLIRDVHTEQLKTTSCLARIEQSLLDTNENVKEIKEKVDKHEKAYNIVKYYGVQAFVAAHFGVRSMLTKLGL